MCDAESQYDEILLRLLEQHKNSVPDLLRSISSFLSRKTDYFTSDKDRDYEKLLAIFREDANKVEKSRIKEQETEDTGNGSDLKYKVDEVKCPTLSTEQLNKKMDALARQGDLRIVRKRKLDARSDEESLRKQVIASCEISELRICLGDGKNYKICKLIVVDSQTIEADSYENQLELVDEDGNVYKVAGVTIGGSEDENEPSTSVPTEPMTGTMTTVLEVREAKAAAPPTSAEF